MDNDVLAIIFIIYAIFNEIRWRIESEFKKSITEWQFLQMKVNENVTSRLKMKEE